MTRLFDLPVGRNHEFLLALQNQGATLEWAEDVIKYPSKAKLVVGAHPAPRSSDRFAQFAHLLRPLDEQLDTLQSLNERMPRGMRIPGTWFFIDTASDHVQSVDDLETWFVELPVLEQTWAFNQKLIELTQGDVWDSGFAKDAAHLRLDPNAKARKPGIHRIRINLVDHWSLERTRLVDEVRRNAAIIGKKLAGIEVIGAYGLQDRKLLQSQDGRTLPYCDLAGLQQGSVFNKVPDFGWRRGSRQARFSSWKSNCVEAGYAAPSLVE